MTLKTTRKRSLNHYPKKGIVMEKSKVLCSVFVTQEDTGWYVATDIATSVASQGKTYEESLANLKEALELYYEDGPIIESKPAMFTTLEVLA